jgi:excisionase family DNA binding protein
MQHRTPESAYEREAGERNTPRPDAVIVALNKVEQDLTALTAVVKKLILEVAGRPRTSEPWIGLDLGAKHAGVSTDLLRALISRGELPAGRLGRVLRVRRSDLDCALLTRATNSGDAATEVDDGEEAADRILRSLTSNE